ncbi:MAG: hypothetical protein HY553_05195 [Elusimicrobia bacterium]|nr:hypothetical protein [Elusimicrobiota bacterium]
MQSVLQETEVAVEFPQRGEVVRSPEYSLRVAAPAEAETVEVSIDGGEFRRCRFDGGRWWFDWANYGSGYHTAVVRARFHGGYVATFPPHEMQAELGERRANGKNRQTVTQFSVLTQHEPGQLARLTQVLSREGIDLAGVVTERFGGSAAIRFVTRRESGLRRKLETAGFPVVEAEAFQLEMQNRPADFNKLAAALADEGINILNLYSTTHGAKARCVVTVDQPELAVRVLEKSGIEILGAQD